MLDQLVGQSIDRYQIASFLSIGRFGAVYVARDVKLKRSAAMRMMHAQFSRQLLKKLKAQLQYCV